MKYNFKKSRVVIILIFVALIAVVWFFWKKNQILQLNSSDRQNVVNINGDVQELPEENGVSGTAVQSEQPVVETSIPLPNPGDAMEYNTPENAINASNIPQEDPQPIPQTYSYITNCNQACTAIGYDSGYCGDWIENDDNTISECANQQEFPFSQYYYDGMKLNDCQFTGNVAEKKKVICCCKGEPQNPADCPAIQWPSEPTECIEQPGYLRNSKTGTCCWYRATCYGPRGDEWTEYKTKAECLAGK